MLIRLAREDEAAELAALVRRSITELCAADYRNDPTVLARWLADKTSESLRRWIMADDRSVLVAETDGRRVVGVGIARHAGTIDLNYVSPGDRFHGVSKALVLHMEALLGELGCRRINLNSTSVARRFYRELGYEEAPP